MIFPQHNHAKGAHDGAPFLLRGGDGRGRGRAGRSEDGCASPYANDGRQGAPSGAFGHTERGTVLRAFGHKVGHITRQSAQAITMPRKEENSETGIA